MKKPAYPEEGPITQEAVMAKSIECTKVMLPLMRKVPGKPVFQYWSFCALQVAQGPAMFAALILVLMSGHRKFRKKLSTVLENNDALPEDFPKDKLLSCIDEDLEGFRRITKDILPHSCNVCRGLNVMHFILHRGMDPKEALAAARRYDDGLPDEQPETVHINVGPCEDEAPDEKGIWSDYDGRQSFAE